MKYFTKTAYWGPLFPNVVSVEKTTNTSFRNPCSPYAAENEAEFVLVLKTNMLQYPYVCNKFQKYEEVCE